PLLYAFFDVSFSISLGSGLTVERRGVEEDTKLIDAKTSDKTGNAVTLTYYPTENSIKYRTASAIDQYIDPSIMPDYILITDRGWAKRDEYFARKDYYLTAAQWGKLDESDQANYKPTTDGRHYINKKYATAAKAQEALAAASTYSFETDKKAFSIRFDGKLYVQVQQMKNGKWVNADTNSGLVSGTISSDGSVDTTVVMKQQDGMELNETVRVVLRAVEYDENLATETTKINYLVPYKGIYDFVHWNGIFLSPELAIEAGVGIGVEVLKAELYIHFNIGASFTFGAYNTKYDPGIPEYVDKDKKIKNELYQPKYLPAKVEEFEAAIGIALRVVLILFTYELDFVSYQISYDGEEWEYGWHFLNDMAGNDADDSDMGFTIRPPQLTADKQKLYSTESNAKYELFTQAFNPGDSNVPFQLSDYASSADAVKLSENIPAGSQYKVLRVGEKNYIAYTISRETAAPEDSSMLVLSELGYDSVNKVYGLKNPVGSGEGLYIPLDNDLTGDLDFSIWADGSTIHAAWVSYASPADTMPLMPEGDPYSADGVTIDADNYKDFAGVEAAQAWYSYYAALESYNAAMQDRAKSAAENTVVKTASWTVGSGTGFSTPETLSGGPGSYVFLPDSAGDGSVVFFGSNAAGDTDGSAYSAYAEYQDGKDLPAEVTNYLKATKKAVLDMMGTQSAMNLAVKNGDSWSVNSAVLNSGETLANVEFTCIDGAYYAAYTTERTEYTGGDMITVYSLYLRQAGADGSWGQPYLLRQLRDYDQDKAGIDGMYSGGALIEGRDYDSPYLSNLRFLTANLDENVLTGGEELSTQDAADQTILIFEMDGASYVIPQAQLKSITGGSGGTIYPFFTPTVRTNPDGETVSDEASGKLQVDINVDTDDNIYAVYVGSAPGTAGNALYRAAYDADEGKWSNGVMLAMHDMDVCEAAVRNGWDQETTEAAYLWGLGESNLSKLYDEEVVNTVKNAKSFERGDGSIFNFSEIQTTAGANNELLVVTQGSLQTLDIQTVTDNSGNERHVLGPKYTDGAMDSRLGTYAVAFDQGSQALGKGTITFAHSDFSAGSELYVTVTAENVGDAAFRGSESQPITATLKVSGMEAALKGWTLEESVISGQSMEFTDYCSALTHDLHDGDKFTLTITDGSGVSKDIVLFTVEEKPDLSVDGLSLEPVSLSADGKTTTMAVSFVAANHGSGDATNVYVQFTYVNQDGTKTGLPLDTAVLTVADQEQLATQETGDAGNVGTLELGSISKGYGRLVKGTIDVPSGAFAAGESGYADIHVEIFSDASTMTTQEVGVITANHGEYYSANNISTQATEAFTNFTAAHSIVIPLGTTTKIPIKAVSSRGQQPALTVQELNDDTDGLNIGILNFKK
ncbi:MAG: hypothetical protein IJG63_05615, partial [Oscillospiraceae bacterium]|nr:hypothetical protein [Oscillospiraceae bacterium]